MATIDSLQTDVTAHLSELQTQANAAITRLSDTAATWSMTTLSPVDALALSAPSLYDGTKPALDTLTIDALISETLAAAETLVTVALPALPDFSATDLTTVTAPVLPAAPQGASTTAVWSEAFWTDLKTRLTTTLSNITGADDVDSLISKLTSDTTRVQDAIFAEDLERKQQVLTDLYSMADAQTGNAGFNFPNSMTVALKLDAQQKYQFDLKQTGRELIKQIYEWARGNMQFALQQGIAAHGADVEFNVRYAEAAVQTYTATINGLLGKYREDVNLLVSTAGENVRQYTAQITGLIDAYRAQNDVALKTFTEKTDAAVKRFSAESEVDLRAYKDQADVAVTVHKTLKDVQREDQRLDVEIARVNAAITEEDMRVRIADYAERVRSFLETTQANIRILDENVKNRISSASAVVNGVAALAQNASQTTVGILTATGT